MVLKKINKDTIKAVSDEELEEYIEFIRIETVSVENHRLWCEDDDIFIEMLDFIGIVRDEVSKLDKLDVPRWPAGHNRDSTEPILRLFLFYLNVV